MIRPGDPISLRRLPTGPSLFRPPVPQTGGMRIDQPLSRRAYGA
jgi:hypothetical protein